MSMSYPVDCTFRRDFQRAFPGADLPALMFLSSFDDGNGYCMSTRDCIKQDEILLREEKRRLENKVAHIEYTLDWLEKNKEELLICSETEQVYEEPDDEFAGQNLVYQNSSVFRDKCPERPQMPSPRVDHTRHNDTNVPTKGQSGIQQELAEILKKKTSPNVKMSPDQGRRNLSNPMRRLPTEDTTQHADTFSRNSTSVSDGSSMSSKDHDAPVCLQFLFNVKMTTSSGYTPEREKLSFRKNETLDVVEEWSTSLQKFYRVRNSDGQLGIVSQQLCLPSLRKQSVLWGRPWFHQNITRRQAESLLGSCTEGSFLIRDSSKEIGNFVLSLKTNSGVGHYVITSHSKGYKFCNQDFVSLEALKDYFATSPLDKGTCLISSPSKLNSGRM